MTTIKTVADRAGVSTATVSRVLSMPDVVQPATRARVREAIEALGYAPNHAAKSLRMLRTCKIIVMVPDVSNPFFSEVLRGAEDAAQGLGYAVLLGDTRDDAAREDQFAAMLGRKEADGLIFLGHRMPASLARMVRERGSAAPLVNACDVDPARGIASVRIDNAAASAEAMALLRSMGHRRVGVIAGPPESPITIDRLRGVRGVGGVELVIDQADYSIEQGARVAARMLARADRPSAIFCFSDEMALGAMTAARAAGLRCPADLSIVGFDDVRYARHLDPALTTVRQPMAQIGAEAVKLLMGILDGGAAGVERVTLEHELVVRGSTGPAPF